MLISRQLSSLDSFEKQQSYNNRTVHAFAKNQDARMKNLRYMHPNFNNVICLPQKVVGGHVKVDGSAKLGMTGAIPSTLLVSVGC